MRPGQDDIHRSDAGLYVHIPFCSRICPYCEFAVRKAAPGERGRYVAALRTEAQLRAAEGWSFDTIYFGGGTPSAIQHTDLARLLEKFATSFHLAEECEVFLEANPEDVTAAKCRVWKELGITTLSLGVQSFVDRELRRLGRRHRGVEARKAVEVALEAGFDVVSVDLIFGVPAHSTEAARSADGAQSIEALEQSLDVLGELEPQHVSCYQLTFHEGTPYALGRDKGSLVEQPESTQADLYELLTDRLGELGYDAYEVSNFARNPSARSRHNQKYWDHTPYLGLGMAAHSFRQGRRWWNPRSWSGYLEPVEKKQLPEEGAEQLTPEQLALEAMMLGVRTSAGIHLEEFKERYDCDLEAINRETMAQAVGDGLARHEGGVFRLTASGFAVADAVARSLSVTGLVA